MILYPLKIEIVAVVPGKELAVEDFIRLKENTGDVKPKYRFAPVITEIPLSKTEAPVTVTTAGEMKLKYQELQRKAEAIRTFIETRVGKNLNMKLDPVNQPDAWIAAHKLFKGDFDEVSYKMYITLIQYVEDLGRELGNAMR